MLGGLDPVIIFQFSKLAGTSIGSSLSRIPVLSQIPLAVEMPPIPVYFSERLFNIVIVSAAKNVDIETSTETLATGKTPDINQKGIQSSVSINIEGNRNSIALTLLGSLVDSVYDKVTSKEYSISFLYGSTTVFRGVLHSFSSETIEGTDKLSVKIIISKGAKNPTKDNPINDVPGSNVAIPGG